MNYRISIWLCYHRGIFNVRLFKITKYFKINKTLKSTTFKKNSLK